MTDKTQILKTFDNTRLMDVIKNYRQYDYDEETRQSALAILQERGISVEDLKLTGNFENQQFNEAEACYRSFFKNSLIALVFYISILVISSLISAITFESLLTFSITIILSLLSILLYMMFLIRSFLDHNRLYKLIGNEYKTCSVTIYYLLGVPLYLIFYFVFKKQMYDEMKQIR